MFIWAEIPDPWAEMGSIDFAMKLLEEGGVAVSPGRGFGEEGDGFLRLALVENENRIRQALKQMRQSMKEIDNEIAAGMFKLEPMAGGG